MCLLFAVPICFVDNGFVADDELKMERMGNRALIEQLRTWRRDASSLHQYEAAAFVGDKILSMTSAGISKFFERMTDFWSR